MREVGKEHRDKMRERERERGEGEGGVSESGRRSLELPVWGVYKNVRMEGKVRVRMGE